VILNFRKHKIGKISRWDGNNLPKNISGFMDITPLKIDHFGCMLEMVFTKSAIVNLVCALTAYNLLGCCNRLSAIGI
jgi:hypothetical protein